MNGQAVVIACRQLLDHLKKFAVETLAVAEIADITIQQERIYLVSIHGHNCLLEIKKAHFVLVFRG
jgi:xanthine dehydrogenase molybdopterin-binding subunit B